MKNNLKKLAQYLEQINTGWSETDLHDQIVNLSVLFENLSNEIAEVLQKTENLEVKLRQQGRQDAADDAVKLIDNLYNIADYVLKAEEEADIGLAEYLG